MNLNYKIMFSQHIYLNILNLYTTDVSSECRLKYVHNYKIPLKFSLNIKVLEDFRL